MRININIDDKLMRDAMKATGLTSKRAVIEESLRTLIQLRSQTRIRHLRSKVHWAGDLATMRTTRT